MALAARVLRATIKKGQLFWGKKCIWVTWLEDFLTSKWPGSFTALAPLLVVCKSGLMCLCVGDRDEWISEKTLHISYHPRSLQHGRQQEACFVWLCFQKRHCGHEVCGCLYLQVCPAWGRGTPLPPCPFTSRLLLFFTFSFSRWFWLFSSFVHPFTFYQNSPTPFPGRRS